MYKPGATRYLSGFPVRKVVVVAKNHTLSSALMKQWRKPNRFFASSPTSLASTCINCGQIGLAVAELPTLLTPVCARRATKIPIWQLLKFGNFPKSIIHSRKCQVENIFGIISMKILATSAIDTLCMCLPLLRLRRGITGISNGCMTERTHEMLACSTVLKFRWR